MNNIKKTSILLLASISSLITTGCGYDNEDKNIVGKSSLVSVTPLFDITAAQMQPTVTAIAPGQPAFGIKGYRIVYKTHNEKGKEIEASGLITVPVPTEAILKAKPNYSISMISDQHGTIFPDYEAPTSSVIKTKKPTSIGSLYSAVGGFMTLQPDYIGFGQSVKERHPYLLEKSSASTVIDMITASIKFANDSSLLLNGQIFLSGYSEGGYVTLSAAKEIEKNHPELHLNGVAPMSGPYDLNLTGMGVLSQPTIGRPDFIGGIIYSYTTALDLNLSDVIPSQYASKFPTLFNATKTATEIQAELTHETKDFIVPSYRSDFLTNPKNTLRTAFVENSVDDFKPKAPTRLYYCSGDKTIDPRISLSASKKMGVVAYDLNSSLGHAQCAIPAYGAALKYFNELRSK